MAIVVKCSCGKQYRIKDEQKGKRLKCPSCGQILVVPTQASGPAGAHPATAPKKSAPPAKAVSRKKEPSPQRSRKLLIGGAGLGVVLLGFALWFVFFPGGGTPPPKPGPQPVAAGPTTPPENKEPEKTKESKPPTTKEPSKNPTKEPEKTKEPDQPTTKEPGKIPATEPEKTNAGSTDVRKLQPLTGRPVDRGMALERFSKTMPVEEMKKWLEALTKTTGKDNNTLFLQCVSTFGHKMGVLFDGNKFKPDASTKMLKRLDSLNREDYRQWLDTFNTVMGQQCSDTAVALLLPAADVLFETDAYAAAQGQKYLKRLKQLDRLLVDRWCQEVPAFKDDQLDAALSIAVLDRFFDGKKFNLAAFDKGLGKNVSQATEPEKPVAKEAEPTKPVTQEAKKQPWQTDPVAFARLIYGNNLGKRPPGGKEVAVPDTVRKQTEGKEVTWQAVVAPNPLPSPDQPNKRVCIAFSKDGIIILISVGLDPLIRDIDNLTRVQVTLTIGLILPVIDKNGHPLILIIDKTGNPLKVIPSSPGGSTKVPAEPIANPLIGAQPVPPPAPTNPLLQATIKLETVAVNRAADILKAEQEGKDIRSELEKSRDHLTVARYNLEPDRAKVVREKTAFLKRWTAILEARKEGQDLRTVGEKLDESYFAALHRDPQYQAARGRLLGVEMLNRETDVLNGAAMTKLEQAMERLLIDLINSREYQDTLTSFQSFNGAMITFGKEPIHLSGWRDDPGAKNNMSSRLAAWSRVEVFMQAALKR